MVVVSLCRCVVVSLCRCVVVSLCRAMGPRHPHHNSLAASKVRTWRSWELGAGSWELGAGSWERNRSSSQINTSNILLFKHIKKFYLTYF